MKKLLTVTFVCMSVWAWAQNHFPPDGNVGIGTGTSVSYGLVVNGSLNQTTLGRNTTSAIRLINTYSSGFGRRSELQFGLSQVANETLAVIAGEYSSWDNSFPAGDLVFGTASNTSSTIYERMRIKWNGNIGIGTANPSALLDIFGNNATTTNIILSANYADKFRWRLKTVDRSNAIDMDFTASDGADQEETVLKLTRTNSGRPEFQLVNNTIVANDGNVGIGTTVTSGAKLTVAGDVHSREVRVTVTAGSDFVFDQDYKLKTLTEVEQFINTNNHLPDVASASEMQANGVELGKMDMTLLQKVEELTLYMIQFQKEMDKLKAENERLKASLLKLEK